MLQYAWHTHTQSSLLYARCCCRGVWFRVHTYQCFSTTLIWQAHMKLTDESPERAFKIIDDMCLFQGVSCVSLEPSRVCEFAASLSRFSSRQLFSLITEGLRTTRASKSALGLRIMCRSCIYTNVCIWLRLVVPSSLFLCPGQLEWSVVTKTFLVNFNKI